MVQNSYIPADGAPVANYALVFVFSVSIKEVWVTLRPIANATGIP